MWDEQRKAPRDQSPENTTNHESDTRTSQQSCSPKPLLDTQLRAVLLFPLPVRLSLFSPGNLVVGHEEVHHLRVAPTVGHVLALSRAGSLVLVSNVRPPDAA